MTDFKTDNPYLGKEDLYQEYKDWAKDKDRRKKEQRETPRRAYDATSMVMDSSTPLTRRSGSGRRNGDPILS